MIQMIVSKLTSKAQTTIPQSVRRALQLKPGDELEYRITDDHVILTKAHVGKPTDDPFRAFDEWSSEADEEAYADL
jgi:antitoxin PrlF